MEHYPTINGISVPTREIWTPQSQLRDCERNKNNHHGEWTETRFCCSALYKYLRNMDTHQEMLQIDVHDWIHQNYDLPRFPTPRQAMEEIERGYWEHEQLKIRKKGHYMLRLIDLSDVNLCKNDYNKYK